MNNAISINTPKGVIAARIIDSDYYPGIQLTLNGELVAIVEFDSSKEDIQVCAYDKISDKPKYLYLYKQNLNG